MTDQELDKVLANWHTLNKALRNLNESEVKRAIHRELVGNKRHDIAKRLHSRYCMMRQKREIEELLNAMAAPAFAQIVPELE